MSVDVSVETSSPPAVPKRKVRWGHVVPAAVLAAGAIAVCGGLGLWQWERASEQGEVRQPLPPAPITEVAEPASPMAAAVGREVWAKGSYAVDDAALVFGREVEGEPAVLVVRPFTVDLADGGTPQTATLPIVVGWLAPDEVATFDPTVPQLTTVEGHIRSGEGAAPARDPDEVPPAGSFWADRLSPAVLAQYWDAPLYSGMLTASEPEDGLRALPEPEEERSLDFRSVAYAIEWWLFGGFFAFIAFRWMRDNGLTARAPEVEQ